MSQEPTIGRIVHYVTDRYLDEHRPAIVVECGGNVVNLQVFSTDGPFWADEIEHDEEYKETGTWHWPERTS